MVARVKAAERERAQLEGAKAVAEAYLGKQRECTAAEAAIFQIFIRDGQVPCHPLHLSPVVLQDRPPASVNSMFTAISGWAVSSLATYIARSG